MISKRFLLVAMPVLAGWAPLRNDAGEVLAWPAEAWPLPLADGPRAWRLAATRWTEAADLAFVPLIERSPVAADGVVAVVEVGAAEIWTELVGDAQAVAFTLITADGTRLTDADVVLNRAGFRFTTDLDPRAFHTPTVLAHELGHAIGLGHSCDPCLSPEDPGAYALMHPRREPGEARSPGLDDQAGVAAQVPELPIDRPRPLRETALDPTGLALVRTWTGEIADPPLPLTAPLQLPGGEGRHLEVWSTAGQGAFIDLPAAQADGGPTAAPPDDGCRQTPLALFIFLRALHPLRRKNRCVSHLS